jgi:Fe-S cluster assembly protein SufD
VRALQAAGGAAALRAAERVRAQGLPNRRVEAWRHSDLRSALADRCEVRASGGEGLAAALAAERAGDVIGLIAAGLAGHERVLTPGAATSLSHAPGGAVVRIDVPAGADVTLNECFDAVAFAPPQDGGETAFVALWISLGQGARLRRVVRQRGTGADLQLMSARVQVAAGACFEQVILAEGARLSRIETHVDVAGPGAVVRLNAAYLADAGRHVDLTFQVDHRVGGSSTHQMVKGVVAGGGRGVFQGCFVVHPGADGTVARQRHGVLLLDDGARSFAKPELMIYADDVECAHGATAGALDDAALFYLRQRGVPQAEARRMLMEAFVSEAFDEALDEELRARLRGELAVALRGLAS